VETPQHIPGTSLLDLRSLKRNKKYLFTIKEIFIYLTWGSRKWWRVVECLPNRLSGKRGESQVDTFKYQELSVYSFPHVTFTKSVSKNFKKITRRCWLVTASWAMAMRVFVWKEILHFLYLRVDNILSWLDWEMFGYPTYWPPSLETIGQRGWILLM